jgi:hypothetical protein
VEIVPGAADRLSRASHTFVSCVSDSMNESTNQELPPMPTALRGLQVRPTRRSTGLRTMPSRAARPVAVGSLVLTAELPGG